MMISEDMSEKGFVLWFTGLPSSGKTTLVEVWLIN